MGEIVPWKGKRADYHFELDRNHFGRRNALGLSVASRAIHGIFIEGDVDTRKRASNGRPLNQLYEKQDALLADIEREARLLRRPVDVWYSDPQHDLHVDHVRGAGLGAGAILAGWLTSRTPKERTTRRKLLKGLAVALAAPVFGAAASDVEPLVHTFKDGPGRPKLGPFGALNRQLLGRRTVKARDEHAGAMIHEIVTRYQEEGVLRPSIGIVWGAAHAQIGQLVESDDNHDQVMHELARSTDKSDRLLRRLTYNPATDKWTKTPYQFEFENPK